MARKNEKLLVALFKYHIIFVLILGSIFITSYFVLGMKITKYMENGKNVPIYDVLTGDYKSYKDINTSDIKCVGGFIQVLDNNKNVIYSDGIEPKDIKKSYTEREFEDIISMNSRDSDFTVFCRTIDNEDGTRNIVLIMIPKDTLSLNLNLKLNGIPYKVGKPLYTVYIKVIVSAFMLSIITILVYSMWTSRKLRRPLMKIDEALGKIIEGDYEEKLNIKKGEKEFVVISDTINFLIDKLKNSKEENAKLEQSKTRLLMDLSHDIKTPMTTIRGFSAALYEGLIVDEEKKQRYYKTIYNKAEHVGELVDELFEFVKMESTQYDLKLECTDICEFTRQVVASYFDEIEEKDFLLEIKIPEDIVNINIDIKLFRRVISNLIENSLKYNPPGTRLTIEIREFKTTVKIQISDNGIGISEKLKENIFDAFVRGDESRRSDGGSGLGLAIAKKIVNNHGGEIVILTNIGEESTMFSITMEKFKEDCLK